LAGVGRANGFQVRRRVLMEILRRGAFLDRMTLAAMHPKSRD
jgi:hypothetical protein